jgi:hypothetical protein
VPPAQPRSAAHPAVPPETRVHDELPLDACAEISTFALGPTSTGAFLAPFADARGDAWGDVPPLGHMSVAPSSESRDVVGPVRRLTCRKSKCESADGAGARAPRPCRTDTSLVARQARATSVSPVAAPGLTESIARAVALGANMPAEGLSQRGRPMHRGGTHRTRRGLRRPPRRLCTRCSSASASARAPCEDARVPCVRRQSHALVLAPRRARVRCSATEAALAKLLRPVSNRAARSASASSARKCRVHQMCPTLAHPRRLWETTGPRILRAMRQWLGWDRSGGKGGTVAGLRACEGALGGRLHSRYAESASGIHMLSECTNSQFLGRRHMLPNARPVVHGKEDAVDEWAGARWWEKSKCWVAQFVLGRPFVLTIMRPSWCLAAPAPSE